MKFFKYVWVVALVLVVAYATWHIKPTPKPTQTTVEVTVPVLDSILKDSLTDEIHNKTLAYFGLEQAYNALWAKYKEIKPDTVFIGDSSQTFTLNHEWIVKIVRQANVCSVYTFRIDSLAVKDSIPQLDSVVGDVRIYPFKFKESEFVITSKAEGVFLKVTKEFPFSFSLGPCLNYVILSDTFGFSDFENMSRFNVGARAEVWYKSNIRLGTEIYNKDMWKADLYLPVLKIGKIKN